MATIQTTIKLNDQFTSALKHMNKALNLMVSNLDSADRKTKTAFSPKSVQAMRSSLKQANVAIQNMAKSQDQFNKKLKQSSSSADSLWGKLKSIAGAYAGWQTAKMAVGASDKFANNTARLGLLTGGDNAKTAALQQSIYNASQRSLTDYSAMTDAVAKLGITASQAFNGNEEIVQFTEILQKQFKIAGTGAQEASAAMYQLTQAMASGRLQGDEFRSILENAPMLAQSIAKEMGVGTDKLKEMSSQGKITADVIKNALFNSAGEVNEMYKKLPMTFGGMWTQVVNKINKGLEPLYVKLGKLWASEKFQSFVDTLTNGFIVIANAVVWLIDVISSVVAVIRNNWAIIEPILIAAAITYLGIMIANLWAMVPPLVATAIAWLAINWPILIVMAAIAAVIFICKKMGWTFSDVIGAICGAFRWLGALVGNIFKGIANVALGVGQWIVQRFQWVGDTLGVIFSNIGVFWNNLWQNAKIKFYGFLDAVLSGLELLAKPLIKLADLFGLDLGGAFDNLHGKLNGKIEAAEAHKQEYGELPEWNPDVNWETFKYSNLNDAYNKGFDGGAGAVDKLKSSIGLQKSNVHSGFMTDTGIMPSTNKIGTAMKNATSPMLDTLNSINANTADTATSVSRNNEDMSYLRDLAERTAINNISSNMVKVDMPVNNNVNSNVDLDGMVDYLGEKVYNTMLMSAEGSHF